METKTCKTCNETKDISSFEKNRCKCKPCRIKSMAYKTTENLPDWYIKKLLKKEAVKKNIDFICSEKAIQLRRAQILKERDIRKNSLLLITTLQSKKCKVCNKVKSLNCFKNGKKYKRTCHSCRNNTPKTLERIKKYKINLTDTIVKANIMGVVNKYFEKNLRIKASDIPQDFIDLKRKELILKRKIKRYGYNECN